MKNLNKLFNLLLSPLVSFFILFNMLAYAEDEPNNSCAQAAVLLEYGTFYNSDSGSSSIEDLDFYYFDVPDNGELNVTIENTSTAKSLTYSSLSTACPSSAPSTLLKSTSTTITIPSTSAEKYYIYVEGVANSPATGYTISARFTPNTLSDGIDLKITKAGSIDTALIYEPFYYTINVNNIGEDNASNVVVTDTLPPGMSADLTATNAASDDWTCSDSGGNTTYFRTGIITCSLDGNLTAASLSSIILHVKAPSTAGTRTNEVTVTSDGTDVDTSNNTATETTEIINEVDTAENLCYTEYTELENPADYNATCEKRGNFYYGNTCKAYVAVTDVNITDNLSEIIIYKMYAPDVSSGACTYTTDGSDPTNAGSSCDNIDNATDYGGYHGGYAIDTNESISDASDVEILINDIGTDNSPRVDGIAMYGDYWTALGYHHTGRIYACSGISEGGIEITSSADVIDTPIGNVDSVAANYNAAIIAENSSDDDGYIAYIRTMVAATQTRNIEGVHLDLEGFTAVYQYEGSVADDMPYEITPVLADSPDGQCLLNLKNIIDPATGQQLVLEVPSGHYSVTGQMTVSQTVRKNTRMQLIFVDPNALSVEGQECIANSSTTGNFARLAQCTNSAVQYKTAFGQDAWDRCGESNGNPCLSSNHGWSCGDTDTTCDDYNPIYDNELGCYMCTFNIQPACSTDNFAIRPDEFNASITHADGPNLLRSGVDYNTSLIAINADDAVSTSYTVLNFDEIVQTPTPKKYFNTPTTPWEEDTEGLLHGTATPTAIDPSHMVNGLSSLTTSAPASAQEIVGVTFDDVGRVGLYVADVNWSQVDNDDTEMDCNSSEHTYICGELNVTFIPHHFSFAELNITNQAGPDSNFTYVADNRGMPTTTPPTRSPMAARLHAKIEALTEDGGITQNFKADDASYPYNDSILYYENPVDITMVVKVPTTGSNKYLYPDANESNVINSYIGFGRTGLDDHGTRNVLWDESNFPLEFNFHREINEPANPFDVNGSYLKSIKIVSHYIDPDDGDTADINGSRLGDWNNTAAITDCATDDGCEQSNADNNATFYYGRTHSSKFFYDDVTGSPVKTPIIIDVYCNPVYVQCEQWDINQTSDYEWWLSLGHNMSRGDGNIELMVGNIIPSGSATVTTAPSVNIVSNAKDENVQVTATTSTPRPMTVEIDLATDDSAPYYTNAWLIYNQDKDAVPSPFYRVQFVGKNDWAGHGDTGHVVDSATSYKKNRRLEW